MLVVNHDFVALEHPLKLLKKINFKFERVIWLTIWSEMASTLAFVWLNMAVSSVVKKSFTKRRY